jgi:pimeloyl-ACP methyl ester carboxylesterase
MIIMFVLVILMLVLLASGSGICWYVSQRLLYPTRGRSAMTIAVRAIDQTSITLQRTKQTKRAGVFGLQGTAGQAIVGPILAQSAETITRELRALNGHLLPDTNVAWNTTVYGNTFLPSLHLAMQEIQVAGPLGALPAWYVPGSHDIWAILVHGATGTREQTLRACKTLADCGLPLLAITYRNDEEAPASGASHLGATEWQDLEAAVRYALDHQARALVLYGWSLGGTIVEVFLDRSPLANAIQAVVLDSPVLNWRETLKSLTSKNHLPPFIAQGTEKLIERRTGVRLDDLDQTRPGKVQRPPTLLFHGEEDTTAPVAVSETFAASQASVTYHRVSGAEHTQCWNADPAAYEGHLRAFLTGVLRPLSVS